MQRERPAAAAAPRDRLEGGAAGSMARSAVASEESCVRCNESQGVDKEPVPLTSGLTHEYSSNSPPEVRVRGSDFAQGGPGGRKVPPTTPLRAAKTVGILN